MMKVSIDKNFQRECSGVNLLQDNIECYSECLKMIGNKLDYKKRINKKIIMKQKYK